jgi:hypothetical protein
MKVKEALEEVKRKIEKSRNRSSMTMVGDEPVLWSKVPMNNVRLTPTPTYQTK